MSKLRDVASAGQSIWLDDLSRALVTTGELRRLLDEDAVTGVTSNPTIFAKAISGSTDYDEQLRGLAERGADTDEAYVALVTEDIQGACDTFREHWQRSQTRDGWASVEVSPAIAYDTDATVAEVREWVKRVDRDNLFVKVPATAAGIAAIERLTAEGISINVTLIFSLERYREVAEAYISGLEHFVAAGGDPSRVHSVASFFVSRVDAEVDRRLEELAGARADEQRLHRLKGRAGIANARVAYGMFLELFNGPRWDSLKQHGARPQRPLWASTGVKDPSYRDTMYVEELIAPDTINTMPETTIRAFQDHGNLGTGPFTKEDIHEGRGILDELSDVGIDYRDVTEQVLERDGVEKFEDSFDEVMRCLERKLRKMGRARQQS